MKVTNETPVDEITQELGARLKQARLNRNVTQAALAKLTGLSRKKVMQAEAGQADLETIAKMLQAMGMADKLESFIPIVPISPIQLSKLAGKKRQRASGGPEQVRHYKKAVSKW